MTSYYIRPRGMRTRRVIRRVMVATVAVPMLVLLSTPQSARSFGLAERESTATTLLFASSSSRGMQQKKPSSLASKTQPKKNPKSAANLLTWARDTAGIEITTQIDLQNTQEAGWGWWWKKKTETPRDPGSLLVTVPASAVIAVDSKEEEGDTGDKGAPWYVLMALELLERQPRSSPWRDALPAQLDTPLHWSSSNLEALQYPHLQNAVAQQESRWRGFFDQYANGRSIDYASFVWGCEMARSRAFAGAYGNGFSTNLYAFTLLLVTITVGLNLGTLEQASNGAGVVFAAAVWKDFVLPKLFPVKRYVICPMIDMANHRSTATAKVEYEFFRHAYSLVTTAADPTNAAAGTEAEICISYGERSNDQLLQYYGFVETDNPHDVYVLPPMGEWTLSAAPASGRLAVLEQAGLLSSPIVVTRENGIDPIALRALRVLFASQDEWTERAQQAVTAIDDVVASDTEQTVREVARKQLQQELDAKPTTLAQDRVLLARCKDRDEQLAIQFRIEKKSVLLQAVSQLSPS